MCRLSKKERIFTEWGKRKTDHRVCGMEDVEEPAADGSGQDVVLMAAGTRADASQGQEHRQRRTHAEKVLYLWKRKTIGPTCVHFCVVSLRHKHIITLPW